MATAMRMWHSDTPVRERGIAILSGDGSGGFTVPTSGQIAIGSAAGSSPLAVIGDFNGDGKADLAVADQFFSTVTILLGNGANGFTRLRPASTQPSLVRIQRLPVW